MSDAIQVCRFTRVFTIYTTTRFVHLPQVQVQPYNLYGLNSQLYKKCDKSRDQTYDFSKVKVRILEVEAPN